MANKDIHNQILRGQFGKVWIDGELFEIGRAHV